MSAPTNANFTVTEGDTARTIAYTLTIDANVLDLTNSTASLNITNRYGDSYHRSVTIVSPVSGSVRYDLVADDVSREGTSYLQFQVDYNDGTTLFVPTTPLLMDVIQRVGGSRRAFL